MKYLFLRKSVLWILYVIVNLYFMIFNWKVFTISLNVNLGFGAVKLPPFIILFALGFIIIGILVWMSYHSALHKIIYELEQGVEIGKLKDKTIHSKVQEHFKEDKNLAALKERLGISSLTTRQDELQRKLEELEKTGKDPEPGSQEKSAG